MSNRPSMLINLPPPPSDPTTPSELGPGTPNSTTTSLSALSVVAIKDGAAGHNPSHNSRNQHQSTQSLDAERADRISRLAGLERVSTVRAQTNPASQHSMIKEISTVGTASATGSVGAKTTWASEMDYDDKMSESTTPEPETEMDHDETSSIGGMSEGGLSLVGFGEGAGSTMSGPISTANARMLAARNLNSSKLQFQGSGASTPVSMSGVERQNSGSFTNNDLHINDSSNYVSASDTQMQVRHGHGVDLAEAVMHDKVDEDSRLMNAPSNSRDLGKFGFERD